MAVLICSKAFLSLPLVLEGKEDGGNVLLCAVVWAKSTEPCLLMPSLALTRSCIFKNVADKNAYKGKEKSLNDLYKPRLFHDSMILLLLCKSSHFLIVPSEFKVSLYEILCDNFLIIGGLENP